MAKLPKLVLLGLVTLMLCVQAVASVTLPSRAGASSGGGDAVGGPGLHAHASAVQALPGGTSLHCQQHATHRVGALPASRNPAHGVDCPSSPGGHTPLKCCSATLSMAAMPAPSLAPLSAGREAAPRHPLVRRYQSVTPDGLERPPKFSTA
jgi:hypothetical protein